MTTAFKDGSQVEVGMFGYEGAIGLSALMGSKRSFNRVYTQIAGHGYSSPVGVAKEEFDRCADFQTLALRYVQIQLVQAAQSAGCNARHHLEKRLARWLLLCADRIQMNSFNMPQEFLAAMLGTTRPTVSLAAGRLKEMGLIEYSRGLIRILDATGLEEEACECYRLLKDQLDNYVEFESGIAV